MRSARSVLALSMLVLAIPSWGKQASQSGPTPQPTGDPQAVAVVQAAITAFGGAMAIGQAQGWTFQATLEGSIANGSSNYSMGWDSGPVTQIRMKNGTTKKGLPSQSLLVPAIIGSVLLDESQDPNFTMRYGGTTTIDSKPVSTIVFSVMAMPNFAEQTWWFDSTTSLPVRVEFHLPAEVGSRKSFSGIVDLSDYRSVSGVMHPFRIVMPLGGRPPEIIVLQSVTPTKTAPAPNFDGTSGDLP